MGGPYPFDAVTYGRTPPFSPNPSLRRGGGFYEMNGNFEILADFGARLRRISIAKSPCVEVPNRDFFAPTAHFIAKSHRIEAQNRDFFRAYGAFQ